MGKVHGSLSRAGKVRAATPKVEKQPKKRKLCGRARKRKMYEQRIIVESMGRSAPKSPNSQEYKKERDKIKERQREINSSRKN